MSFSNTTIRTPVKGKPHIVKIDGFWRVSACHYKDPRRCLYHRAHEAAVCKNVTGFWPSTSNPWAR